MQIMQLKLNVSLIALLLVSTAALAGDWPQFLGPHRNGVYDGSELAEDWPATGPPIRWQKSVGHGFSGPVVADRKLVLFDRQGDKEVISCFDSRTGKAIWDFTYATTYVDDFGFDDGPRATPSISEGRLYTFGAQGMLSCLDFATGKRLWSVDLKSEFQAENGFFGMACSPLVEGNAVVLNIGGKKGAGIVALDKASGKLLWKASDDEASYSSPVAATIGSGRYLLFLTRNGLVALDPKDGGIRAQYPWHSRNRMSVNAATPLVVGGNIFLSACYDTGAVLLRLQEQGAEKIWSEDDLLSNHYTTSVELNGFLYGIHGRTDPGFRPAAKLRCVELKSKRVCWETDSIGAASIIRAGNRFCILTEKGELVIAAATPENFQEKCRARILSSEVRPFPSLAEGLFYARSKDRLVCVNLGKGDPK